MRGISKLLLGLGLAAVMIVASMPVAEAQCANARTLGAGNGGNTYARVQIVGGWDLADGTPIGSIWEVGNTGANNGGAHFGNTGICPETAWFSTGAMFPGEGKLAVDVQLASTACQMTACPGAGSLVITLIEDASPDGSTGGFAAYTVDDTPTNPARWYDHARTQGVGGTSSPGTRVDVPFNEYPTVDVTASAGPVPNTTLTANYADLALNIESAAGPGDAPVPASESVVSYDIMQATSLGDPGRDRAAYTLLKSIPYGDAGVTDDTIAVPCGGPGADTWVAVGATFADNVPSILVGKATAVECDPAHADPGGNDGLHERKRIQRNRPRSIRRSR